MLESLNQNRFGYYFGASLFFPSSNSSFSTLRLEKILDLQNVKVSRDFFEVQDMHFLSYMQKKVVQSLSTSDVHRLMEI